MQEWISVQNEIACTVGMWARRLADVDEAILAERRNSQGRTVKQIVGHLIDSATNNLHRMIHLQYQQSPCPYPDYANLGVNDIWIAVQHYQDEEWRLLVDLWHNLNRHLVHVIGNIDKDSLVNVWISALGEEVTLQAMVIDYPRHLQLHLGEIAQLLGEPEAASLQGADYGGCKIPAVRERQLAFYRNKLTYEIDSWDLAQLRREGAEVVVIDVRAEKMYRAERVAGAISLPHRTISVDTTSHLDRSKSYVVYCDGIGCNGSTKGAMKLAELGFTVRELQGGLDWWKRDGLPTEGNSGQEREEGVCGCNG